MSRSRHFIILVWLGLASDAHAAERPPATRPTATFAAPAAVEVKVTGKYKELVGQELFLTEGTTAYRLSSPELQQQILQFKAQRDNLSLVGTWKSGPGGKWVEVSRLERAASDLETLTREFEESAKLDPTRRAVAWTELATKTFALAKDYGQEELLPLARKSARAGLDARLESIPPGDGVKRLRVIEECHTRFGDPAIILDALVALADRPDGPEAAKQLLAGFQCRKYRGRWVTHEEFKRLQGFQWIDGKWLLPREKDMFDAVRTVGAMNQTNLILRKRTEREYRLLAEKGVVEDGMRPEEVCLALGFPDRVERRLALQKEFDQWAYSGRYYYFYGGLLVLRPKA